MAEAIAATAGVAAAVIQAKTAIWDPLQQTIASSNNIDELYENLDELMKRLVAVRTDCQNGVQRHRTTKKPKEIYHSWIERVKNIETEVTKLKNRYDEERTRSRWFCINPRSNFSEKMKKTAIQVTSLLTEGTTLEDFLVDKERVRVVEMIAPRITNIPTLQQTLEKTLSWLSDIKVTGIRIHGFVGSGKTTIMQNLNNHEKVAEVFDIVMWVTVSREGSVENMSIDHIQRVIAKRLKIDIGDTTDHDKVASMIREELTDMKYLLLLDDVKKDLDLNQIGVPINDNGSKIVLTTRLEHVCFPLVDRQTNVKKLDKKEALNMFKNVLHRPDLEEKSNFKQLMPSIVEACGLHPLMIKVVAGAFSMKKTEQSWHDGLENLKKWPEKGDHSMQDVYKLMEVCFDYLKVTQKKCFFYSALYPEQSDIYKDCLLDNWAAEDLLDSDDVQEMYINGREILEDLKMVSLIEESTCRHYIRIHKLIRQAALHTLSTNEDQRYLVKSGEALQKPPNMESWKEKSWISLVDSNMDALPDQPHCSKLSTLFLQKNPNLKVIPLAFFEKMEGLRVLDLYGTGITSLPSSLLKLVTLKVLYLQKCVALVEVPHEIEVLRKLEVFDIRGSGLVNVPPQIQRLICLRRLLVSFTSSRSGSRTQNALSDTKVISKISMLRELVIEVDEGFESVVDDVITNVDTLTNLTLLQFWFDNELIDVIKVIGNVRKIHFPAENHLRSYINKTDDFGSNKSQIFTRCHISSNPHFPKFSPYYIFDGEVRDDTISKVLQNAGAIELVNHKELEHLSTSTTERMNNIRGCVIKGCDKLRTLVDGNVGGSLVLQNLEKLHMINLPVLKDICEGPTQGLSRLKTLILCNCPMMTWVCAYGVILQLPEIRHLEIEGCSEIKEIFTGSANIVSPILPKLKKLVLVDMPQLRSILVSSSFEWPSLERLKILRCPALKKLPFKKDTAVKLTFIKAEKSWWEALEDDDAVKKHFRHYCTLS